MSNPLIQSFVNETSALPSLAAQYLSRHNNDLVAALNDYRTHASAPRRTGVRTLNDLNEAESDNQNFFTGGEKLALAVENPDKDAQQPLLIERIFQRARDQMLEPDDRALARDSPEPPQFAGTGFRLGDTELPSVATPGAAVQAPKKVLREITFWRQGFTIGDGPLMLYDDPRNEAVLQELRQGRVPVSVLGVEFGQDVDVLVVRKTDEDYVPPRRAASGFHGDGQRLGSPVPGETAPEPTVAEPPAPIAAAPAPSGDGDAAVQIRFASGKRTMHKFSSTDPVSAVYAFVRTHSYNSDPLRLFVLSMAFPVKPIEELATTVADARLANAVVVQRWT